MPSERAADEAVREPTARNSTSARDPASPSDSASMCNLTSASDSVAMRDSAPARDADGARPDPAAERLEWGPVRLDRLRSLAAGIGIGLLLAVTVVVGVAGVAVLETALAGGLAVGDGWVLLVLLAVGGPLSVVYLLIGLDRTGTAGRRRLRAAFGDYDLSPSTFRPTWTAAGSGGFGALLWFSPELSGGLLWLLVPLIWVVPMLAGSRGTSVALDPVERTIERTVHTHDRSRTDDLNAVVRTRRIDLPWLTTVLLAYRGNDWYRSTPWLFVPTERADEVERAIDAVLARSDGPDRASVPERVVLALVGSSSLIVGVAMAVAGGESGGWVLAVVAAPLSVVFLALALRL